MEKISFSHIYDLLCSITLILSMALVLLNPESEKGIFGFMNQFMDIIHYGPSGVRALPLAARRNEGGHYFMYMFLFSCSYSSGGGTVIQNTRRGCCMVPKFCMGS